MSPSVTATHQLLWVAIPVALCASLAVAKSSLEIRMIAANLCSTNPAYVGPGAYFRVSRKSRNSNPVLNAFLPMIKDLPIHTNVSWHCFRKINNGCEPTMITGSVTLCDMLESKNKLQRILFEFSNLPSKCPVKKGNYTIKDFYIKTDGLPPVIPGSDWKAHCSWGIAKATFMVYTFEMKVLRKDLHGPGGSEAATALVINV